MKTSLKKILTIFILLLQLTHQQSQWNLFRITKGLYGSNAEDYLFQLYNPDKDYKFSSSDEFLLKSGLPDYSKFHVANSKFFTFSSELTKYNLKFQFMGMHSKTKYFRNLIFNKEKTFDLNYLKGSKTETEPLKEVEDYFYFYRHANTFNNNIKWDLYINMYEEDNFIQIDVLTFIFRGQPLDLYYLKPKIEDQKFIFNLIDQKNKYPSQNNLRQKKKLACLDKKLMITLKNDIYKNPVFFNFLIISTSGLINSRFKGFIKNRDDMNHFENYLGGYDGFKNLILKTNKFNYVSGFYMTSLDVAPGRHFSLFQFNTIVNKDKIEVQVTSSATIENASSEFLTTTCISDQNEDMNLLLSNSLHTDFNLVMKSTSRKNGKLTFKFDENTYENIDTKNNPEFEFFDFMVTQIFPEDIIKCNISVEKVDNLKIKNLKINIDILIKTNDQIQTKAKVIFNEKNLEVNLYENFFKENSKNDILKTCVIRNPEEYKLIKKKKIFINEEVPEILNSETNNSEIYEIGFPINQKEIYRCFLYIKNKRKEANLEIMLEKKVELNYYPKLKLNKEEKSVKLFTERNKSVECNYNGGIIPDEIIKEKFFIIETRLQNYDEKYDFKDYWKPSEEEENEYYINLNQFNKSKINPLESPLKSIGNSACFVKFEDNEMQINIFSSLSAKLKFNSSQNGIYDEVILLGERNEEITKTTNLNLDKSYLTSGVYKKDFNFFYENSENAHDILPFDLFLADLDTDTFYISNKSLIKKYSKKDMDQQNFMNLMNYNLIFLTPQNMLLSVENLLNEKTLKILIWKDPKINEKNLNTGIYSLNTIGTNDQSKFFMTEFKYDKFSKSISCETETIKKFASSILTSEKNIFFFDKNNSLEKNKIKNENTFSPLIINSKKPNFEIKSNIIRENAQDEYIFSNIYYTTPNEKLLFLCFYPDGSRLNINLYDLNNEKNNKKVSYQNYSWNIGIMSSKKSILEEKIENSSIIVKIKFLEKKGYPDFSFLRDLTKVKCEYINLVGVDDGKYFDPKIKVNTGKNGVEVEVSLKEKKMKKILI